MADRTAEKIKSDSEASISALSAYLDQAAPSDQFGSNVLGRIGNIKPIASPEDVVANGLIGENGLITPKGSLFSSLLDHGLLNRDGTPTELGTALVMDEDDALRRENLKSYQIRQANRVNEAESVTMGETLGKVGEYIWNAGAGLGTMIKLGLSVPTIDPIKQFDEMDRLGVSYDPKLREEAEKKEQTRFNRNSVGAVAFQEGSLKAISEMGAMINLAGSATNQAIIENFYPAKLAEQYRNTDAIDEARQAQARLVKSNQDAALGTTLDAVVQSADYLANLAQKPSTMPIGTFEGQQTPVKLYADEMARAKAEMPKAEFDKLVKQTTAAGEVFQDPAEMMQLGTVAKLAFRPVTSRAILNADRIIAQSMQRGADIAELAAEKADIDNALGIVQNTTDLSKKLADDLRARYDVTGDQSLLRRATVADEIFNRGTAKIQQFTGDGVRITDSIANLTAESEKLATKIPLAAAQTFEAAAKVGRELKAVPFKTFAAIVEPVGLGLIKLDDGLNAASKKFGIEGAYNLLTSKVGQTIGYGTAVGLGPVPAVIGAAGTILNSGPFLQRLADTSRILGTEMAKSQSQIPFFQRVANYSNLSPAHRALATLADTASMGGFLPDIARRAVRGTALSFPADFVAQYMSDGGQVNENTFKQAFAESLLLGGSSAALGGIFAGTKKRHRDLSVGDEINFRNEITSPDQKRIFSQSPSHLRRAIGTFSAVFPSMNVQLTESGGGFHDDNTIGIDVNSSNPLKYLLAHEVKHLLVHRNQMHNGIVAMMLGDGETGGLMRAPDGTLNPEFEAFAKEYNSRQISAGRQPVSLGKIAEEFFVEAGVEDMAGMAESGALGAMASRTEARRMIGNLFNAALDKSTVLKDFHLKIGGLMDQGGKLVQGNGLLDPGITQTREMRNMTKNMLSRAAGRSVGQFEPLGVANVGNKNEGPGINLPINPEDKAMIEKIGPVEFEMETVNGVRQVARDSAGNPIPVDFNTQLMRSRTGTLIQEAIGNRPSTYQAEPGEMHLNDEGIWEGYLPPDLFEFIKRKGSLNQEQIRIIDNVNKMIKNFKGDAAMVINHPATSRNKKGKLNYKTLKATLRQVVPISWNITKDGNLTLGLMSVTQLKSNVDSRIASKMGQKLYQGNRAKLMIDVGRVMELHNKGQRTDAYFDSEYGAAKSQQYKNFVNSVFGLMSKKQGEANPIFSEENLRGNGVYKTYRADRISQATKLTGDRYPFQYDFVVQNMMPNGMPTLDEQGRPVAQNYMTEPARNNVNESGFYSQLERTVSDKIPNKATPQQIMATIDPARGSGVKADEIKWSGIEQAMESLKKDGKVSKEDVLNYLRDEGRIKFEEVTIGDKPQRWKVSDSNINEYYDSEEQANEAAEEWRYNVRSEMDTREIVSVTEGWNVEKTENNEWGIFDSNNNQVENFDNKKEADQKFNDLSNLYAIKPLYDDYWVANPNDSFESEQEAEDARNAEDEEEVNSYVTVSEDDPDNNPNAPQFSQYVLPRGENYQEVVLSMPSNGKASSYTSTHFPKVPNYVAHMRTNERVDADGKEGLFVEEFQSDRHQEGRKQGYKGEVDVVHGVADAPFRTTWPLQLFKRALRDAVSSGKDWIGWTDGETQNERFDLSEQVDEISYSPENQFLAAKKNGKPVMGDFVAPEKLESYIGKDIAKKLLETKQNEIGAHLLKGKDLKVGGSGMKGFYDQILPKEIEKYVKPLGGKVEKSPSGIMRKGPDIDRGNYSVPSMIDTEIWRVDITPEMRRIAQTGQPNFLPEPIKKEKKPKKEKERQVIGPDRVIDKGDADTLDVIQAVGAKTNQPSWKDDKPVPVSYGYDLAKAPHINKFAGKVENASTAFLDTIPYNLNDAERKRVEDLIKNGVVDHFANDMVKKTRIVLKDPAIAAGKGWYSRMRVKLLKALGEAGREIFSQFLGATSAQTPVDENFQQAVDANEGLNSGRYDRHRKGYLKAISAESNGTLNDEITKTRSIKNIQGILDDLKSALPRATVKADRVAIYAEIKSLTELIETPVDERTEAQRIKIYVVGNDLLPRRSNGAKFNANSGAVLKVIAGVWLNNRESPKTPNFAGNLSGRTVQATIDIWAARFLRRQIYGGEGVPWRIQPKSEVGVSKEDFAFSQIVMERAAKKLGMNPDDLQAILWFAEKDVWDKKGWTKNEGAKKSSFDDIFDIFFPEGKRPLTFAEGSAIIRAKKDQEKTVAAAEKKAMIKAEAATLGISVAALNRMKKAEK